MKLSDIIKSYRREHDLSQRQFAEKCGLSNGYISIIEAETNPHTNKKANVSLGKMYKIAQGMGISLHELFSKVDDMPVKMEYDHTPTEESLTEGERALLDLFRLVPAEKQEMVVEMIRVALGKKG